MTQDIKQTLYIGLGGAVLTGVVVVPPWPVYNKTPVGWLPARKGGVQGVQIEVDGQKVN